MACGMPGASDPMIVVRSRVNVPSRHAEPVPVTMRCDGAIPLEDVVMIVCQDAVELAKHRCHALGGSNSASYMSQQFVDALRS